MEAKIYNQKGVEAGKIVLPAKVFSAKWRADLVHQVVEGMRSNKRAGTADTKGRGEVRGGGKKPWAQKGTGRARHGSIRSPLWKGGGVTHGPRIERVFERDIPKKMRRKALFMVLSEKAKNKQLLVLDKIELEKGKTKEMVASLSKLPCNNQATLIAMPNYDKKIFMASRNIKKVVIDDAKNLNVLEVLSHKYLLITKESIKTIENTFAKGE